MRPISGYLGTLGRCRVAENHPKTGLPEYPTKGCTLPPCYLKMTSKNSRRRVKTCSRFPVARAKAGCFDHPARWFS